MILNAGYLFKQKRQRTEKIKNQRIWLTRTLTSTQRPTEKKIVRRETQETTEAEGRSESLNNKRPWNNCQSDRNEKIDSENIESTEEQSNEEPTGNECGITSKFSSSSSSLGGHS